MAYYIISFDPEPMKLFQKRFSFLDKAVWIQDKKGLASIVTSAADDAYFLVHFTSEHEMTDELVLIIRETLVQAKIIYLVEDEKALDLKAHQMTPVGGDAYTEFQVEGPKFKSLLGGLVPPSLNPFGNRLESPATGTVHISEKTDLKKFNQHPKSKELEKIFAEIFVSKAKKPAWQKAASLVPIPDELEAGVDMSDKEQELSLDDLGDLELSPEGETKVETLEEIGLDLDLNGDSGFDLSQPNEVSEETANEEASLVLSLDDLGFSLEGTSTSAPSLGDDFLEKETPSLDFSLDDDVALDFGSHEETATPSDEMSLDEGDSLDLGGDIDLSDAAKEKMKEIDAIMDFDASQVDITIDSAKGDDLQMDSASASASASADSDIDTSLVADDLDLASISFSSEEAVAPVMEEKSKKKNKEVKEIKENYSAGMEKDFKEISGAYSGEMERTQATISNLRSDREELLARIQRLEEDKVLQNRQTLTMRAELDEKKIELTIIRKKLNDEISQLKDRLKLFEERKMILEEKNKIMAVELDKAAHKNKIDVKKVQMRERELEQKLELLKADSESQIRHRDLKILELKRKLDAMEFDIESISVQEKRSVESRFELEDKLDKAIKTLRNAITVLEDESDKSGTLEALKKNIDM